MIGESTLRAAGLALALAWLSATACADLEPPVAATATLPSGPEATRTPGPSPTPPTVAQPTPTTTPAEPGAPFLDPTPAPILTPLATLGPQPPGWVTQLVPASRNNDAYSFNYPPSWFVHPILTGATVIIVSYDQQLQTRFPADAVYTKVDILACAISEGGCTGLRGGSPTVVAGEPAEQQLFSYSNRNPVGLGRSHTIQFERNGVVYALVAYYGRNVPESDETFRQIAASFVFIR